MPFENETRLASVLPFLPVFQFTDADHPHRPANVFLYPVADLGGVKGCQVAFVEVLDVTWRLSENGGEIMVQRVNANELARAVPTSWHSIPLNAPTIAQRIAWVISGEPINCGERISDTDGRVMLGLEA